ncbi:MAG: hypothetical protein ACJ71Q_14740 [Terriglobales bacterium]
MKPLRLAALTAFAALALTWFVSAQTLGLTTTPSAPASVTSALQSTLAMLSAIPAPADDPLLDSSGNVVLDSSGQPQPDPNEMFHQAKPQEFDPAHTNLVQAAWLNGIGCPTNAFTFDGSSTTPYTDSACPTGDPKDQNNEGLLMVKTGPTANFASAVAELKKVKGITLTELGYDIRKSGGSGASPLGSHCGAGAPRFNVVTQDGVTHFIGCNSPPGAVMSFSSGWVRLRWTAATAFPQIVGPVERIQIVFDEGQDTGGLDNFGAAILDNIDVNGMLVGHGATDAD